MVEADETSIGEKKPGKRGRGATGKILVAIAVQDKEDKGIERIRLRILENASANRLTGFVEE